MRKIFFILALLFFIGCERKTDWPLQVEETNFIVVDGIITNEMKPQSIHLTYTVADPNIGPLPVIGAAVQVSNEDSIYYLNERPVGSGWYVSDMPFSIYLGKNYTLIISKDNEVITAKSYMVKGYDFKPLVWVKNTNNNLYHIAWGASPFDYRNPAMWEVFLDWSNVPGYLNLNPDECKARLLFYTLPTLDVSQIFAPRVESISFPIGTQIRQSRYSLNPDHAEFIRSLLSETNWQGGVFSSVPANLKTNLSDGAVGYFGACDVETKFLTVNPGP